MSEIDHPTRRSFEHRNESYKEIAKITLSCKSGKSRLALERASAVGQFMLTIRRLFRREPWLSA